MTTKTSQYLEKKTKKGIEDELMTLHEILIHAEECLSLMQNAFIYNKCGLLQGCMGKVKGMRKNGVRLMTDVSEIRDDNPDLKRYVSVPIHIKKIIDNIDNLTEHIKRKIDENILFSDKAVRETVFLLQRLTEILLPTADILLARNSFLTMYIQESQEGLGKMAMEYATLHEERLIKGVCNNLSSSMYIGMLEAIKNIAWNSKEIAVKLAGK